MLHLFVKTQKNKQKNKKERENLIA